VQGKLHPQRHLRAAITVLQPETQVERVGIRAVYSVQCRYQTVKFPVGGCGKCHLQFGIRAGGGSQVFQFHIPQGQVYPHAAGGQYLHIGGGFGGKVQALGGNVYHVCRGSVLELENKKYLCFGGAESQDVEDREPGVNWWKEEMPSEEEYAFCEENLAACDYKVDYVLTHDAPSRFLDFTALASGETNQLHSFLDKILLKLTYDKWFFGCYHKDTQLSTKSRCVFCDVISMGERHAKRSVR
jgi:hypothetical protein